MIERFCAAKTFYCSICLLLKGDIEIPVQLIFNKPVPAGQHIEVCGFYSVNLLKISDMYKYLVLKFRLLAILLTL